MRFFSKINKCDFFRIKKHSFFILTLVIFHGSLAWADIQIRGSSSTYTETAANWRSIMSNDIDGNGLGTDGYIFFGNFDGNSASGRPFSHNVSNLPSYATVSPGSDFLSVADEFAGYGSIEDPTSSSGALSASGILIARNGNNMPAGDFINDALRFTISGLTTGRVVRVGVLSQIEGNSDGRWDPTSITLTNGVDSATVGDHNTNPLPTGGSNVGWVFFDVNANGTYTIQGTKRITGNQGIGIGGLTFDSNFEGALNFPLVPSEGGYSFPNAFPGLSFNEIAFMESIPDYPNRLFVGERRGRIWMIPDVNAETPTRELFVDLQATVTNGGNLTLNGMGGIAFHPDFANNGYIYISYPRRNQWSRVSRFTANPENFNLVNNSTEQILFEESYHRAHGINRLVFGPDGYLYIPMGDGRQHEFSNPRPIATSLQTIDNQFWSSILRIDVDKRPENYEPQNLSNNTNLGSWRVGVDADGLAHYSIPSDNPFLDLDAADGRGVDFAYGRTVNSSNVRTEMWATGFRNPWKIGFVPGTSDLWVADVMSAQKEKYMIVPKGGNAGWAFFSGTGDVEILQSPHNIPVPSGVQYIQPVVEYRVTDNGSGSNNKSIIGGEFYQSPSIPTLTGAFMMCDFNRGDIWAIHRDNHSDFQMVDPVLQPSGDFALDSTGIEESIVGGVFAFGTYNASIERIGAEVGITAMLPNPSTGEMLLADFDDGIIRKISFTPGDFDSQLPQTLSATGAFNDVESFEVSAEMNPYDVNLTFWSDGALKSRFFNMVNTDSPIQYSQDGFWEFPVGMVTMKHFDLDLNRDNPGSNLRRIETRFLVQAEEGYYGMTYQWNEEGTEATLVDEDGANLDLQVTENGVTSTQTWRLPSRGECYQCHTNSNNVMLGFGTRQQNHFGQLAGSSGNFLTLLESAGYLSPIGSDPASLPKYSEPSDLSVNIEERVKSYLAVNCAYCHYEGNGIVPDSWSGEHHLTIEETNLLHGVAIGFNVVDTDDRLVIPGDSPNSIILSRVAASNGYARMPPIGSNIVDPEGITLLTEWINDYANARPRFGDIVSPFNVLENSLAATNVGEPLGASDPDSPSSERGNLNYSIINGNTAGFFEIDPISGQLTLSRNDLDFEEATSHQLTVKVTDAFTANPGVSTASFTVNVLDLLNDDSQGDGIADEWAVQWFSTSTIDPTADFDGDGFVELLEYWADSDPTDASELGLVLEPTGEVSTPGSEGFFFEWNIRSELIIGGDYIVQGSSTLDFVDLSLATDFELISSTPVNASLSRIKIKIPTEEDKYFLRLRSPN